VDILDVVLQRLQRADAANLPQATSLIQSDVAYRNHWEGIEWIFDFPRHYAL